jgi:non-canonical (house-cleaning) NTP pyrophosphatase
MSINAQPFGEAETVRYARARRRQMCLEYGQAASTDISIESGAIAGQDVAVVLLYTQSGNEILVLSQGIPFPDDSLEVARERGFKTTTAGDIIHERYPHIPGNSWQVCFPPFISREQQIQEAVERALRLAGLAE